MIIKGIYTLPNIKHTFFIVSDLNNLDNSKENKKRIECLAQVLQSKDKLTHDETKRWTLKAVSENDLLNVIESRMPIGIVSPNLSSHNPSCLELLTINLIKTDHESKELGNIPEEDIIEIFI